MRKAYIITIMAVLSVLTLKGADSTRPFTFWYWMYGAVSKEGIQADLVGMKNVGLGGCYLMPIRGTEDRPDYEGKAQQLSPDFWDMVDYAFSQADSLGLEIGIHICDGFALAGHPSIAPEESMQKVVWTDTVVMAKDIKGASLRRPQAVEGYYEDIACYAVAVKQAAPFEYHVGEWRTREADSRQCDLGSVQTIRSVRIIPSGNNIQSQRIRIMSSDDGKTFKTVRHLRPCRQGWQSSGPAFTYSLPKTTARYIRLEWSPEGTEPGAEDLDAAKWTPTLKVKDIVLSSEAKIEQWEGKTGLSWRVGEETPDNAISEADCLTMDDMIQLRLEGDKVVSAVPGGVGLYRIYRFGHTSTGQKNATAGGGKGLEIDKFNALAVEKLFDNWYRRFIERPNSSVVKYLHVDSWECGTQNWGHDFASEFKRRRGYDLVPYILLYAGVPIESREKSEKVLRDIRYTVNELVHDVFFTKITQLAHQYGRQVSEESIAPTFVADGIEHYKMSDLPMGEFWLNSPTHDKPNDMLDAISGGHIYGKNVIQAEGFTEVRGVWNETPAMLKPLLDRQFAWGMNRLFFHVNVHNPWLNRRPGMTLDGIGLFFQRDNTWYGEAGAFVDYVNRCQKKLQWGRPVVDVAVFTGEEMPCRALTPDRVVDLLPGIFGQDRVESERRRLANIGQPMTESPVGVRHSAGILDLKDWTNAMHGYQYDSMNRDALLNVAKIDSGCLVMPGNIRYRVIVLPGVTKMNPSFKGYSQEVENFINRCRKAGVVIVDKPYTKSDFSEYGLAPDAVLPDGIAYTHRYDSSEGDIYFLSNQTDEERSFNAVFRCARNGEVAIYDPVNDCRFMPCNASVKGGRTEVSVTLPAYGSVFVEILSSKRDKELAKRPKLESKEVEVKEWNVELETTGKNIRIDSLYDLSKSEIPEVKYYSGKMVYSSEFRITCKNTKRMLLNLGKVNDIAHVYVNDVDCGTAWTPPYEVDITRAVRRGKNKLRIVLVNTWRNALLGAETGNPPFEGIWTNAKYRMKEKTLLPSGLLGPLSIKE